MVPEPTLERPTIRLEVPIHHQLREGEEPKYDRVALNLPVRHARHNTTDIVEIGVWRQIIDAGQVWQCDALVILKPLLQRQICPQLLTGVSDLEPLSRARTSERARYEDQWCVAGLFGLAGFVPFQESQRDVEDVDTLLGFECLSVVRDSA